MTTTADPIRWQAALYLDDEPGSAPSMTWAEALLELDAGQDAAPLAVVGGVDGEVWLRLRPLRVRLDPDVLTVVGVLVGDGEASQALVTVCARPAVVRVPVAVLLPETFEDPDPPTGDEIDNIE